MLSLVHDADAHEDAACDLAGLAEALGLDELCRLAAREILAVALNGHNCPPHSKV